ncbi:caspase family protein [Pannonibacter sp. Pt2-lr]
MLLVAMVPARAEGTASRLALVIGNAAYDSAALPALKNPANDAALISGSLKAAGFDVTLVMDADLRAMKAAVRDFTARLKAAPPARWRRSITPATALQPAGALSGPAWCGPARGSGCGVRGAAGGLGSGGGGRSP